MNSSYNACIEMQEGLRQIMDDAKAKSIKKLVASMDIDDELRAMVSAEIFSSVRLNMDIVNLSVERNAMLNTEIMQFQLKLSS